MVIQFSFFILIEGFYGPQDNFYAPSPRGRGFYRRGGFAQGGDLPEQEGFNGFRGNRGGRGRGRRFHRGSARREDFKNDKFAFPQSSTCYIFFFTSS